MESSDAEPGDRDASEPEIRFRTGISTRTGRTWDRRWPAKDSCRRPRRRTASAWRRRTTGWPDWRPHSRSDWRSWMVRGVKSVHARLDPEPIADGKHAPERQIGLEGIETAQHVASKIALGPGGGSGEGGRIQTPSAGRVGIVNPERRAGVVRPDLSEEEAGAGVAVVPVSCVSRPVTSKGMPVRAVTTPSTAQLPRTQRNTVSFGLGIWYEKVPVRFCRTSKLEGPLNRRRAQNRPRHSRWTKCRWNGYRCRRAGPGGRG